MHVIPANRVIHPVRRAPDRAYRLLFRSLILIIVLQGCNQQESIVKSLSDRYLFSLTAVKPSFDYTDPTLLKIKTETIQMKPVPVTMVNVNREFVTHSVVVVQPLELNRRHRYTGVSFYIRSLSGLCEMRMLIMPERNPYCFYIHPEPIRFRPTEWMPVSVNFSHFTNIMTMLNLDIDSFNPIMWDSIRFVLLFDTLAEESQIIEIGPVGLNYQHRRYHFY